MSPPNSKIVINVEHNVLPVSQGLASFNSLSIFVNFTVILTAEPHVRGLLKNPKLRPLSGQDNALFVTEAKGPDQRLESHVPQAISEMYAT
ncbi:hypothetical protein H0H81_012151 [Sphagnurus paluster]|uniref:Uncharacterized protein n=1 Tax=Sphagnurus paluster TaxID=117069 RepID=A0A9P7FUD3_9AGAR|nr:hypothetical protein H0H81_012151 [Sphagnurus paluster]